MQIPLLVATTVSFLCCLCYCASSLYLWHLFAYRTFCSLKRQHCIEEVTHRLCWNTQEAVVSELDRMNDDVVEIAP